MTAGFFSLLTLLLIGLKLTGYIAFAWVWILAPIWVPLACGLAIIVTFMLIALSVALINVASNGKSKTNYPG